MEKESKKAPPNVGLSTSGGFVGDWLRVLNSPGWLVDIYIYMYELVNIWFSPLKADDVRFKEEEKKKEPVCGCGAKVAADPTRDAVQKKHAVYTSLHHRTKG